MKARSHDNRLHQVSTSRVSYAQLYQWC